MLPLPGGLDLAARAVGVSAADPNELSLFFRRGTVNFHAKVLREPYGFLRVRTSGGEPGGGEFLRPREGLGAKPVQFGGL